MSRFRSHGEAFGLLSQKPLVLAKALAERVEVKRSKVMLESRGRHHAQS